MSTLAFIPQAELTADDLTDDRLLEILSTNPEALLDLIYGAARRIKNAAPPHDHDEDGGEPHKIQILSHSFGRYVRGAAMRGIPLGPPDSGTFEESTTDGVLDRSFGKRLFCVGVVIPGGVSAVRVALIEYHESASEAVQVTATLRSLGSVNFKLGVAPEECYCDIAYTTSGATTNRYQSAEITDLTPLGDATQDRELEFALWLTSDVSATEENRILAIEVIGLDYTARARPPSPRDLVFPPVAVKEIKAGSCVLSTQTSVKLKERYNGLNRGLWGSTPGLLNNLQPDRRRTYRESIAGIHQHQGSMCPDGSGGIFGDGAVLRDTQSFGYIRTVSTASNPVAGTPPPHLHRANTGIELHTNAAISSGWRQFLFRRSIPAGGGALVFRIGLYPDFTSDVGWFDFETVALVSCDISPVAGGSSIVTKLSCGSYVWDLNTTSTDYLFCELAPERDVAWISGDSDTRPGWSRALEIPSDDREQLKLNDYTYRVSQPLVARLTYPPERAEETYHTTTDYNIKLRLKIRRSDGDHDQQAGCLWVCCYSAPGY